MSISTIWRMWPFAASTLGTIATSGSLLRFVTTRVTCHESRVMLQHPSPCRQRYACHVFLGESSTRCVAQAYGWVITDYYGDISWWWCGYSAAGEPSDASTRSLSRQLSPRRIFIWSRSTECHRAAQLVPVVPLPDGNCIFLVMCSSFILRARPGHGFTRPPVRIQILILLWKHNYGVGVSQRIWFSISTIQAHVMFMSIIYSQQVGAKTKMFIWQNCNVSVLLFIS